MKFESKFGLGEIVTHEMKNATEVVGDFLMEIVGIQIDRDKKFMYICRHTASDGGQVALYHESELIGDPDFDQDAGQYGHTEGH